MKKNSFQRLLLSEGWEMQSAGKLNQDDWLPVEIPTTVMGALLKTGFPSDSITIDSCWWFKKEFKLPVLEKYQHVTLHFDGISYRANIRLNGENLASADEVFGPFRRFSFDITSLVKEQNVLEVEVFQARPGDPNIGFVDWNPRPVGESMGIFREVFVTVTGEVQLNNVGVHSSVNTETLDEAWLTVETEVRNFTDKAIEGKLIGKIEDRQFAFPVSLQPHEKKTVKITSDEINALHIRNPRLWWCNNLGNPELYELDLQFQYDDMISDQEKVTFGIREIKDYFTEDGNRGFILNGQKVLVKSAGWTDDLYLRDTDSTNEIQVKYVRDMNLNSIRFENIWGKSQQIYDLCDKYGLMVLVGWSCQWEWEDYLGSECDEFGGIRTEQQMDVVAKSFEDQVLWLRNHPSIIAWYVGSDMIPRPALEKRYMEIVSRTDDRPCIASAAKSESEITGPTGMKMFGPYEYVGPNYWYEDTRYGGAYGFNTETGIGAQLPVIESIQKFIPTDRLWPINEAWEAHCTASRTTMNSLSVLTEVMDNKYGKAKELPEYILKAHVIDYEGTRAMFEAFRVHIPQTTGIVQWMLNSAWPSLYWQLYDYYLIPTAGYYAVKKANQPQQLIYNYKENAVYAVNERREPLTGQATVRLYSLNSELLFQKEIRIEVGSNTSQKIMDLEPLNQNVFLSLELPENNTPNFYWLPVDNDIFDWEKTNWVHTPTLKYANQKALNGLPSTELQLSMQQKEKGEKKEIVVTVKNKSSKIAFFTQFLLKDESGEILFPVEWSDNYISLLPGEKRTLTCILSKAVLDKDINLFVSGWNVREYLLSLN
jgi:exo-1,4-beta-D-glucosaminidase